MPAAVRICPALQREALSWWFCVDTTLSCTKWCAVAVASGFNNLLHSVGVGNEELISLRKFVFYVSRELKVKPNKASCRFGVKSNVALKN
jgi:hypothetical protein